MRAHRVHPSDVLRRPLRPIQKKLPKHAQKEEFSRSSSRVDRRATFDDVGDHNVTTKTISGARVRQQVGVPHGAHHRRILEGEKKRGMRGPATRSAFWGCRACKAARDEATKEAREARRRRGERRDWDDWKQEDSEPPQASLAHILSGSCAETLRVAPHRTSQTLSSRVLLRECT